MYYRRRYSLVLGEHGIGTGTLTFKFIGIKTSHTKLSYRHISLLIQCYTIHLDLRY